MVQINDLTIKGIFTTDLRVWNDVNFGQDQ